MESSSSDDNSDFECFDAVILHQARRKLEENASLRIKGT